MRGYAQSREFSLLVSCCRWNFLSEEASPPPRSEDIDWRLFARLARRHRVQGLVWNALARSTGQIADETKALLSSEAKRIAAMNLGIAAACRDLLLAFDGVQCPLLFLKGLAVGALGYRSPLLKMAWDIDLLIDPRDLESAAAMLRELGYELRLPSSSGNLQSWHRRCKESVWCRNDSFYLELHTGVADNVRLIPGIDVHSPRQSVTIMPELALPTLAQDELFAYLAVHGASSAWFRLKWISDFAALIHGRSEMEILRLYERSQQLGAARAAGQALLLADKLFDTLRPAPSLRNRLNSDRATRSLRETAFRLLTSSIAEPTERPLGTLPIHWTQFKLRPEFGYKVSEFGRKASSLLSRSAN